MEARRQVLAAALVVLAGASRTEAGPCQDAALSGDAQADIEWLAQKGEVVGLGVAVIEHGRTSCTAAFGTADGTRAVDSATVFEAASLSKPVFAYAVLRLVDRGVLDLDRPLVEWAPDLPDAARDITPRQVLTHVTGLPNERRPGAPLTALFAPGRRFSYSGEGFNALQVAVERAMKQTLDEVMTREVFGPLGMIDSRYTWRADYASRKAFGHDESGRRHGRREPREAHAASTLHTTVVDYARFVEATLRGEGLKPATWRAMTTPQVAVDSTCVVCSDAPAGPLSETLAWGLGWGLELRPEPRRFFHWGENNGEFHAFAIGSPGTGDGIVLLSNSGNGHAVFPAIVARLLPGERAVFAWMGYDAYDAPWRLVLRRILAEGASAIAVQAGLSERDWNRIGYQLLTRGKTVDAIAVFELNARMFPDSANAHDSLGEALMTAGRTNEAIASYELSLKLDPSNDNARQMLVRLRAQR
jgi:CubicO group peptidase (beta-lactamase class C family)